MASEQNAITLGGKTYYIHTANPDAAELIQRYHYKHKLTAITVLTVSLHEEGGLFGTMGRCVGACTFSPPVGGFKDPRILELTRLVRHPEVEIPLSALISRALGILRSPPYRSKYDLVISYADRDAGHHGGIYQACSWNYHGIRKYRQSTGMVIGDQFIHQRNLAIGDAARIQALGGRYRKGEGKYLYWKPLNTKGKRLASRLGLQAHKYPWNEAHPDRKLTKFNRAQSTPGTRSHPTPRLTKFNRKVNKI